MKVIAIFEENHGFIGVALNIQSAMDFLLEKNWISPLDEFRRNCKEEPISLSELRYTFNVETYLEALVKLYETDTDYFDGVFYFREMELHIHSASNPHFHCPVNGTDCPYYANEKDGEFCVCTLENPIEDCDDFASEWEGYSPNDYTDYN